jgi:dTDP-4-amino-4,6-dideoxy-D-galactose acyltransferase
VFLKHQIWEGDYFGFPCFSIEAVLFEGDLDCNLQDALKHFVKLYLPERAYCSINVPSEDLALVQAIGNSGFKLVETRLNYVLKIDKTIKSREPHYIQKASLTDAAALKNIAKKMRNPYDRVHADPVFSTDVADEYLGKFAEEAVKGFADLVLKSNDDFEMAHGFLAANYPVNILGQAVSKLVLAAIDNTNHKGRLFDLLHEMICILRQKNADYLTTITQAANMPAIKTWEKAGFTLYQVTHLFSLKVS